MFHVDRISIQFLQASGVVIFHFRAPRLNTGHDFPVLDSAGCVHNWVAGKLEDFFQRGSNKCDHHYHVHGHTELQNTGRARDREDNGLGLWTCLYEIGNRTEANRRRWLGCQ